MGWVGRKFDNLGSAVAGTGGGMGLSQAPAFTQAYLQRLGGHIDEARRTAQLVERGLLLPGLDESERASAAAEFGARATELERVHDLIAGASPAFQPVMMLRHADPEIAQRAWEAFSPALPLDAPALIYTGLGVLIALIVYELVKAPAAVVRRRRGRTEY